MRKLLNILAVLIGLIGGLAGVAGVVMAGVTAFTLLKEPQAFAGNILWLLPLLLSVAVAFLGFLIASRAWLHLRHPDARTARDMIGTAIYLIVIMGVLPLGIRFHASEAVIGAAVIGLYVCHRLLVKRIVARAFPTAAVESQA